MGKSIVKIDLIKRAEQYLDAHVKSSRTVRHAAATQGLLSSWEMGEHVQAAPLVIPLIREYVLDEETLQQMFGERTLHIAKIAMEFGYDALTQVPTNPRVHFLRKLRKLYVYAYTDIESVLVCAADHLASTVHFDDIDKNAHMAWAAETLAVDVPLLEMLGMWKERQGIADLALHLHDTSLQLQFEYYISAYYLRHDALYTHIRKHLAKALRLNSLDAQIQMHETTPASLYRRYERSLVQGSPFNPSDPGILRVELITKKEEQCYFIMGMLHSIWSPSASTPIKDWIASPRYNGYRALITTVNIGNEAVEFRIMTPDMVDVNARGVLTRKRVKNAWWTQPELSQFIGADRPDDGTIRVFTPAGSIYQLKAGSTVMDFAFRVHSELGPYAKRFFINGKPRNYDAIIQHLDLIEVQYDQSHVSLKTEWEEIAKTRTARIGIRRHLRGKSSMLHRGRLAINRVLARESDIYNIRLPVDQVERLLEDEVRVRDLSSKEELYSLVTEGHIAPDKLVAKMIENELRLYIRVPKELQENYVTTVRFAQSWLQEPKHKKTNLSTRITPHTDIVGRLVKQSPDEVEVVIHRADSIHAPSPEEAVPVQWTAGDQARDAVQVTVTGVAKSNINWIIMSEIQRIIQETSQHNTGLHNFHFDIEEGMSHIEFTLDMANPEHIRHLEQNLNALRVNNLIKSFKIWEMFPGKRKLIAGLSDRHKRNPYTPHHIKNSNMFFGRGVELEKILSALHSGIHFIILHGDKRIGKTSLLYNLADRTLPDNTDAQMIPILFDILRAAPVTPQSFTQGLIDAAKKMIYPRLNRKQRHALKQIESTGDHDPLTRLVNWVQKAETYLNGRRLIFLVDEFTAVEEAYHRGNLDDSFFERMHHIVDHNDIAFILCIHNHVLRDTNAKLNSIIQRGHLVPIDMMAPINARALIRTPLERFYSYEDGVVSQIIHVTNRHPFYIHILCGELFTQMSIQDQMVITKQHVEEAIGVVLQSGFHRFAHYKDAPGNYGRETLQVIAALCGNQNRGWAPLLKIQDMMQSGSVNVSPEEVQRIVDDLHKSGALQRRAINGQTAYQIRVGLLHEWSRQGTSMLAQAHGNNH